MKSRYIEIHSLPKDIKREISEASGLYEPRHEKTCFYPMRTTKAQISLRIMYPYMFGSVPSPPCISKKALDKLQS